MEGYQTTLKILSNKVNGISEEFCISTFLSRLKNELIIIITMFKSIAFGLARLQEEVNRKHNPCKFSSAKNNSYTYTFRSSPKNHTFNPVAKLPTPYPVLKLLVPQPIRTNPALQRRNPYPIRRISPNQMQEIKEKGLCYFYDERYQLGHKCNRPRLYLLEGMNLEEEE